MNENDEYSHVQRRLCAVIAKSEWTSSRMRMQKSGEELRERRAKSHRTANQFLQELLEKRTDSDLIDDNGAVDRYHNFVKFKSAFHDDTNTTLDEFDRRLRDLNNNRPTSSRKLADQYFTPTSHQKSQPLKYDLRPSIEVHNDENDDERSKLSRILPSISVVPSTSTPNDTADELTTSTFHVDEIHELSDVHSPGISFINSSINPIDSSLHQQHQHSSLLDKFETLNSSTSSSAHLLTQTLHVPKARRADGSEVLHSSLSSLSSQSPLPSVSSHTPVFNHSYLPRSLTSRAKLSIHAGSKRQLPTLPSNQVCEPKAAVQEQFHTDQLYDLLDNLDAQSGESHFTNKLQQLTLSTVIVNHQEPSSNDISLENISMLDEDAENTPSNLFNHSLSSAHEKQFYTTLKVIMNDIDDLSLYTMTLSTVQLSASLLLPYSMLNGRRPLLQCSSQTCFTPVRTKQPKNTCRVTAIERSFNQAQLQANDILLKVQDQSVWGLTTDEINDLIEQYHTQSSACALTIARLCQPFV